ncbi:hypothetical protein [Thermogemmatispora sp.]|uniref:hypothetical protein n=1 Tax=Thermogemmatispora sp. TaxID=1968838 RepID=UPI002ACC0B08|nr:hypothetical protein [Thermogemmatispora sp.]
MRTCLDSSVQRLRASYDWPTDLASALFQAADTLEQADQQLADSFEPSSPSQSSTDSPAGPLPTHGFVP